MNEFFIQEFTILLISPSLTVILGLLLLGFASISFLMSGSEIAYFSLQYKDLTVVKTKADPGYKRVALLLEQPRKLQAVIFVCKVFSTIGVVVIVDILLQQIFGAVGLIYWVGFALRTVIIIVFITVFLELIPRIWAAHRQISFASKSSLMLEIFGSLFYKYSSGLSDKTIAAEHRLKRQQTSEQEDESIDEAIDQLSESEAGFAEKKILKGIRKFGDTAVRQIMKPRMDVHGIEESTPFSEVLRIVSDLHYSRLPVYRNNLDEPVGILHTKDIIPFIDDESYDWNTLIRKTMFVHEQKSIEDLMQEFLSKRVHFAVVVDEFGGTSGIVTLEDIMEEIIGDIKDDFDEEEKLDTKVDEFTYIFDGKQIIEDACAAMNKSTNSFDEVRGDSNTIGGLVLELAGDFPEENTEFDTPHFTIIPLAISKNRIDKVKVIIKKESVPEI